MQVRSLQEMLGSGEALLELWLAAQERRATLSALFSSPSVRQVPRPRHVTYPARATRYAYSPCHGPSQHSLSAIAAVAYYIVHGPSQPPTN